MTAVLDAVAVAPPPRFSGGGKWEAMHDEMAGIYEVRVQGPPNRSQYRLFCVLDNGSPDELAARGLARPALAVVTGLVRPWQTIFKPEDYRRVQRLEPRAQQCRNRVNSAAMTIRSKVLLIWVSPLISLRSPRAGRQIGGSRQCAQRGPTCPAARRPRRRPRTLGCHTRRRPVARRGRRSPQTRPDAHHTFGHRRRRCDLGADRRRFGPGRGLHDSIEPAGVGTGVASVGSASPEGLGGLGPEPSGVDPKWCGGCDERDRARQGRSVPCISGIFA